MMAICLALVMCAQAPELARGALEKAYSALQVRRYAEAIKWFIEARDIDPARPGTRKDLGYTYLKVGETEAARNEFAEAMRLDPADHRIALEYGFLCYETKKRTEARRVFDRIRQTGDAESRATAEKAFQNVDRPLAERIARWSEVVRTAPENFSAHEELARVAEERDDFELAARHYREAIRLKPENRSLLLDLGRALQAAGKAEEANAAFEEAVRSSEPRTAEAGRALLAPGKVSADRSEPIAAAVRPPSPKEMAEKSYKAAYLPDALRYYRAAHDADPLDAAVVLALARTLNMLRRDKEAARWFDMARKSPDLKVSAEAEQAYRNLRPSVAPVRTTAWIFPFFSSRWHDVFSYGQIKTDFRIGNLPVRPYVSTRFVGDTRRTTGEAFPQYLSESSFLFAAGLATSTWRGAMAWAEAGTAVNLSGRRRMMPDYRCGVAFARGFGAGLGGRGAFAEGGVDGVFVSRFQNDVVFYGQNRFGYAIGSDIEGPIALQLYWNANLTADSRREYWANFVEFGPGLRFRPTGLPKALSFSLNLLRGAHTLNEGNPRRPNFYDVRAGFWYAFTR